MEEEARTRERSQFRTAVEHSADTREAGGKCPHCGAPIEARFELCPVCGGKLVDYCTFCGAPMQPGDIDCPECGMPAEGVECPNCHTRNFRSFCRQCSLPLSRAARRAVEKAKQDPKVQEAARLIKQVAELQAELDGILPGDDVEDGDQTPSEPSESELLFQELMAKVGFTPAERPKVAKRKMGRSREEVLAEFRQAVDAANKTLSEMLPPPGMTPQEQRNYYTSRKVAVMEVMEEKWYGVRVSETVGWECNKCHVIHKCPEECVVREFGGVWVTCDRVVKVDEGTAGAEEFVNRTEKKVYKRL